MPAYSNRLEVAFDGLDRVVDVEYVGGVVENHLQWAVMVQFVDVDREREQARPLRQVLDTLHEVG